MISGFRGLQACWSMSPAIETQLLLEPAAAKKYIATYIQVAGPDFDVEDFFQKTSELPLDELQGHLHQLSGELQSELGTIVHRDFDKFIEVFRELGQLGDEDMEELDVKISDFSDEVALLYSKVKDESHKYNILRQQLEENQRLQVMDINFLSYFLEGDSLQRPTQGRLG